MLDLRWLAPLPVDELAAYAAGFGRVLVVDETRRSGGVGEGIVSALVERGYDGRIARVASADSYVPLGPASAHGAGHRGRDRRGGAGAGRSRRAAERAERAARPR